MERSEGLGQPAIGPAQLADRVVVAVAGGAGDPLVIDRAATLAERTGARLLAVHVTGASTRGQAPVDLSDARRLVEAAGGSLHEIAEDDLPGALVDFARTQGAGRLVLGAGRTGRWARRGGLATRVLDDADDLDVLVVPHRAPSADRPIRRRRSTVSWRRRLFGAAGAAVVLPLMTVVLSHVHAASPFSTVFPCYLIAVVALAWAGGLAVGIAAAAAATLLENYYFVPPTHTLSVGRSADVVALLAFLVFSLGASTLATAFARRSEQAARARAEAQILTRSAATVAASPADLLPVLDSLRTVLAVDRMAIERRAGDGWVEELVVGEVLSGDATSTRLALGDDRRLAFVGRPLEAQDHLVVTAFAERLAEAYRATALREEAARLQALAEVDALRTGLLRSVSHDLRTPLASVRANVSSLLLDDVAWSRSDQRAILGAIDRDVQRLTRLITDLLDAGRLEAGVVQPRLAEVDLDDLLAGALETIDLHERRLDLRVPQDLPSIRTDPDLVERAIANVVANACAFSPADLAVRIQAAVAPGRVQLVVSDRGPGISPDDRAEAMEPFRRLDDSGAGSGLGLSVAKGFLEVLGGSIHLDETPGGGLTVVMEIVGAVDR